MSDTEGSQCEGCRWTRNEMAKIRAKLVKAEKVIEVAAHMSQRVQWNFSDCHQLHEALKEYRGEETK